jgi:hypothetical protein
MNILLRSLILICLISNIRMIPSQNSEKSIELDFSTEIEYFFNNFVIKMSRDENFEHVKEQCIKEFKNIELSSLTQQNFLNKLKLCTPNDTANTFNKIIEALTQVSTTIDFKAKFEQSPMESLQKKINECIPDDIKQNFVSIVEMLFRTLNNFHKEL